MRARLYGTSKALRYCTDVPRGGRQTHTHNDVYSRHTRVQDLHYQAASAPCGLVGNIYGPLCGRRHTCTCSARTRKRSEETVVNTESGSLLSNTGGRRSPSAFGCLVSLMLLFRFLPIWAWASVTRSLRARVRTRRLLTTWKLLGEGVRNRGCSSEGCVPWR